MGRRHIHQCRFGTGELGCLFFSKRPLLDKLPSTKQQCILHDNFWKVLESQFLGKSRCCFLPTSCHLCLLLCPFFLSPHLHSFSASALLCSVHAHISQPPSPLLPFPTSSFVLYHWQSRSHAGSQQGGNMKRTMTFSEAAVEERRCSLRREKKRGWAGWRKSREGKH